MRDTVEFRGPITFETFEDMDVIVPAGASVTHCWFERSFLWYRNPDGSLEQAPYGGRQPSPNPKPPARQESP